MKSYSCEHPVPLDTDVSVKCLILLLLGLFAAPLEAGVEGTVGSTDETDELPDLSLLLPLEAGLLGISLDAGVAGTMGSTDELPDLSLLLPLEAGLLAVPLAAVVAGTLGSTEEPPGVFFSLLAVLQEAELLVVPLDAEGKGIGRSTDKLPKLLLLLIVVPLEVGVSCTMGSVDETDELPAAGLLASVVALRSKPAISV